MPFTIVKEKGERVVFVAQNYIDSSAIDNFDDFDSETDACVSDEKISFISFTSQAEYSTNFYFEDYQEVLLLDFQSSLLQENRFLRTIDSIDIMFGFNKDTI